MNLIAQKGKDRAFSMYANIYKNMCENAQKEKAQTHTDREGQTPRATLNKV